MNKMNTSGTAIRNLFLGSPLIIGSFKLFGWEPFASMPWHWVTSPWWYFMLVFTTTCFIYGTIKSLKAYYKEELSLNASKEDPSKEEINKDLH